MEMTYLKRVPLKGVGWDFDSVLYHGQLEHGSWLSVLPSPLPLLSPQAAKRVWSFYVHPLTALSFHNPLSPANPGLRPTPAVHKDSTVVNQSVYS